MGFVGVGGQGTIDMQGFMQFPEVQNVAVCDVDRRRRERAKEIAAAHYAKQKGGGTPKGCEEHVDFRELCARADIDAVFCATPEHLHGPVSCEAMRNGKDVYCEKPETLTIREGRVMVETARRYARVFSGGSQRVWGDYHWFHRMTWGGACGEVKEAVVNDGFTTSSDLLLPAEPVPEGFDWELYLGPAPWRPHNKAYHNGRWHSCRDFGGGSTTDGGAHHIGGALFAARLHDKLPVEVSLSGRDGPPGRLMTFKYPNGVLLHLENRGGGASLSFRGTLGEVRDPRGGPRVAPPDVHIPNYKGRGGIFGDFLHCVKTRERPFRDIELAHNTMVVCHLANIATWVGRSLKFDPVKEEIIGDEEANRWVDRPRRAARAL
jgi:predicted dehydrogenase